MGCVTISWNGLSFAAAAEAAGHARSGTSIGLQQTALAISGADVSCRVRSAGRDDILARRLCRRGHLPADRLADARFPHRLSRGSRRSALRLRIGPSERAGRGHDADVGRGARDHDVGTTSATGARRLAASEPAREDGSRPDIDPRDRPRRAARRAARSRYALGVKNTFTMNVEFYTGVDERLEVPMILPPAPDLVDFADDAAC